MDTAAIPLIRMPIDTPSRLPVPHKPDVPKGWPRYPRTLTWPLIAVAVDGVLDLIFFAASALFLAFAYIVYRHDGVRVADNEALTDHLIEATKYVSIRVRLQVVSKLMLDRARPYSLYFLPQSLGVRSKAT